MTIYRREQDLRAKEEVIESERRSLDAETFALGQKEIEMSDYKQLLETEVTQQRATLDEEELLNSKQTSKLNAYAYELVRHLFPADVTESTLNKFYRSHPTK